MTVVSTRSVIVAALFTNGSTGVIQFAWREADGIWKNMGGACPGRSRCDRIFESEQFATDLSSIARAVTKRSSGSSAGQSTRGSASTPLRSARPQAEGLRAGNLALPDRILRFFYEIDDDERVVVMVAAAHRGSAADRPPADAQTPVD